MNSKHLRAVKTGSVSPEDQTHWRCIAESLKDSLALYCWVQVLPDRCVAASTLYAPQRVRHVRVVMLHVGGYCRRGEDGDPAAARGFWWSFALRFCRNVRGNRERERSGLAKTGNNRRVGAAGNVGVEANERL